MTTTTRTPKETMIKNLRLLPEGPVWLRWMEKADDYGWVNEETVREIARHHGIHGGLFVSFDRWKHRQPRERQATASPWCLADLHEFLVDQRFIE